MERIWIAEQGTCTEENMPELLEKQCAAKRIYLSYHSDGFCSGMADRESLEKIQLHTLLELRVFDLDKEFMARRSSLGAPFFWRIADDQVMRESYERLKNKPGSDLPPELHMLYTEGVQILDINTQKSREIRKEDGSLLGSEMMTTVGGRYFLPVAEGISRIRTKTYFHYDKEGMVRAEDQRYCAFDDGRE